MNIFAICYVMAELQKNFQTSKQYGDIRHYKSRSI